MNLDSGDKMVSNLHKFNNVTQNIVDNTTCPKCKQEPGAPCTTANGAPSQIHKARRLLYFQQLEEMEKVDVKDIIVSLHGEVNLSTWSDDKENAIKQELKQLFSKLLYESNDNNKMAVKSVEIQYPDELGA